jgi:hypothetical protein
MRAFGRALATRVSDAGAAAKLSLQPERRGNERNRRIDRWPAAAHRQRCRPRDSEVPGPRQERIRQGALRPETEAALEEPLKREQRVVLLTSRSFFPATLT